MSRATQARVVLDTAVDRAVVETMLTSSPQLDVSEYLDVHEPEPGGRQAGDVLIVACAAFTPTVGDYVREARRGHPARPVLMICTSDLDGYAAEALATGVEDVVTLRRMPAVPPP